MMMVLYLLLITVLFSVSLDAFSIKNFVQSVQDTITKKKDVLLKKTSSPPSIKDIDNTITTNTVSQESSSTTDDIDNKKSVYSVLKDIYNLDESITQFSDDAIHYIRMVSLGVVMIIIMLIVIPIWLIYIVVSGVRIDLDKMIEERKKTQ